jgi:hypothetical protein
MTTRKDCVNAVNVLNRYYHLRVALVKGHLLNNPSPTADILGHKIEMDNFRIYNNLNVIAHEYAHHIVCNKNWNNLWHPEEWHNEIFEKVYKECCVVLNISYIPTDTLAETIRTAFVNKFPNNKYGLK